MKIVLEVGSEAAQSIVIESLREDIEFMEYDLKIAENDSENELPRIKFYSEDPQEEIAGLKYDLAAFRRVLRYYGGLDEHGEKNDR